MTNQLDKDVAYFKARPIRKHFQMPFPISIKPFDCGFENDMQYQYWYHTKTKSNFTQENLYTLRALLLSFGGHEVCLPETDNKAENILGRGQFWYGDRLYKTSGKTNQSPSNSANFWYKNQNKAVVCTGYALDENGIWKQHTWCVEPRTLRSRIIETTQKKVAYFGFAMTEIEAVEFYELQRRGQYEQ
jgi:hypothetical protein